MIEVCFWIIAMVFITLIAVAMIMVLKYLIEESVTWIYLKMCRARWRRVEWLMKRQEEKEREKSDQ